jgi:hypothetical protein
MLTSSFSFTTFLSLSLLYDLFVLLEQDYFCSSENVLLTELHHVNGGLEQDLVQLEEDNDSFFILRLKIDSISSSFPQYELSETS